MTFAGAVLMTASTAALVLAPTPGWFALPLCLRSIGAAMFWPAFISWLSSGADHVALPRRMGAFNIGWSGGMWFGTQLCGPLYHWLGPQRTIGFYAFLLAVVAVMVLKLPRRELLQNAETPGRVPQPPSARPVRQMAWCANFAAFFVFSAVNALFPTYGRQLLGLEPATISTLVALMTLLQTLTFVYLGVVAPHRADGRFLRLAPPLAAVGLLLMVFAGLPGAILAMLLVGFNSGVAYAASFFHSVYGRQDSARQGGIHEAVVGTGAMFGAAFAGIAAEHLQLAAGWWVAAAVVLAAWALGLFWSRADDVRETPLAPHPNFNEP